MRVASKCLGVVLVGLALGAGCSSSDDPSSDKPAATAGMGSSEFAGAAGSKPSAEAGAGGSSGSAAGAAGVENLAGAGAGGADPCVGEYSCPSVLYWSHAIIKIDLPVSVADAADAVFTACRNDECYSAKGGASVQSLGPGVGEEQVYDHGWVYTQEGGAVFLNFDGSGTTPFALLDWRFDFGGPVPDTTSDHYSLTVQSAGAAAPSTLFDGDVSYTIIEADPSLVGEGFCRHCSEVVRGMVDARAGQ